MVASSSEHPSSPPASRRVRSTRSTPPLGVVVAAHEPLERVLDLAKTASVSKGVLASSTLQVAFLLVMALVADWGLRSWTHRVQQEIANELRADYEVDITKDESPPPPPAVDEPPPEPKPTPIVRQAPVAAPPPLPAAAAAPIVTAAPDPNKIEDMSDTIVNGNGPGNGGVTANDGQSQGPGRGVGLAPTGAPTGTATTTAPPPAPVSTVDKSRVASSVNGDWRCPFPSEADIAGVDEANAVVEVVVRPDGTPGGAKIVSDPGNGFGQAAVRCAMRERFRPALDHDGNPVQQARRFNVHFSH